MELRRLRNLLVVGEEGSFTRAARRLRLAQPALSRQIQALEREIGVPLFDRSGRAARLNEAGEAGVRCARKILTLIDEAVERARLASRGAAGLCIVSAGMVPIWSGFLAHFITQLRSEYPAIDLVVEEGSGHDQWRALRARVADVGLGIEAPIEYAELSAEVQWIDTVDHVAVATEHPLATRASVRLEDLSAERFIWLEEGLDFIRDELQKEFARRRLPWPPCLLGETVSTVSALVGAGQGWTLVPRSGTRRLPYGVVTIPLEGVAIPLNFSRLWRRGDTRNVVLTVLGVLHELAQQSPQASAGRRRAPARVVTARSVTPPSARIELRHLLYFGTIVEEGSIGRAARRLELTQPSLSRQLAVLERVAETRLIEREPRGARATPAGESLYADAREILDLAANVIPEVLRAHRGMTGVCVLATVPTSAVSGIVARALAQCAATEPNVRIAIRAVPMPLQLASVRLGSIDLGIGHLAPSAAPYEEDGQRLLVADDAIDSALLPSTHALAARSAIDLSDLAAIPFLFMDRAFDRAFYDLVMNAFAARDFRPLVETTFSGLETVWTLVAEGRGWALGARSQRSRPPAGLVAVSLTSFSIPWGVEIVGRAHDDRAPVIAVREALARAARDVRREVDTRALGATLGTARGYEGPGAPPPHVS